MAEFNRRDFLKAGAVATTATAAACSYDYVVPQEKVLPYVVNPENVQPGLASYYASLCNGCATACGLVARNKDGRVVGVEGNPDHPTGPGLCTRGHFDLVATYSPDRVAGPSDGPAALNWAAADKRVADAIVAAAAAGKSVAWLGRYRSGSVAALLDLAAARGLRRVNWELLGVDGLLAATRRAYGVDELPVYELASAKTILSFGHDFLHTAFGSMGMAKGWAKAKDPAHDGFVTRLVAVEPRLGQSSSQADHWFAARPGTEALAALAIARLCADVNRYAGPAAALLAGVNVAAYAQGCGIDEAKLKQIAEWLGAGSSVVLPGGPTTDSAEHLSIATLLCNEVLGNIGKSVQFGRGARPGHVSSFADLKALLDDAAAGKIGVLFLDGLDIVHAAPADLDAAAALAACDLVVQLANEPDDSSGERTLLLPTGSGLEQWSDANTESGLHVLGQPAMVPLKDSRGLGDVLLALVKSLPAPPAAAPTDPAAPVAPDLAALAGASTTFAEFLKARWLALVKPADADATAWWHEVRAKGVVVTKSALSAPIWVGALPAEGADPAPDAGAVSLVLFAGHLADGRWANVPWAQELPDPISTYFWTTWAELSPATAARLGLGEKDLVKITTDRGSIEVGWFGSPAVRDNTIAVVVGNGKKTGKYARGRGANPLKLLASEPNADGAFTLSGSTVALARVAGDSGVHALCGSMNQDGRNVAVNVNVDDAVSNLVGAAGSIVPIHHLPTDPRVEAAGPVDMYPEPQHPTYRFAMTLDANACNGCGACQIACAVENNTPFVGPDQLRKGRTMSWIRMDRFFEGKGENPDIRYLPVMCQHCAHAPCEGVCPVLATYHNLDGLNAMIYNRCVGTRYCANNCPYTARRFNYHSWEWPESYHLMLNPDLSTREMGVMEKCTFCVQRIRSAKDLHRDVAFAEREAGKPVNMRQNEVPDTELRKLTACAAACPTDAIVFGNWNDDKSTVVKKGTTPRAYTLFGELNTKSAVHYVARVNHNQPANVGHHGGGHGEDHGGAKPDADKGTHGADAHGAAHEEG
ncbi:MAG: 4Fe-4S dicluster domain-containing protein [Myxococcales bacterium]|nr:4Fe-4S dicluster domain-containing protein [Myxococcales bacterium]